MDVCLWCPLVLTFPYKPTAPEKNNKPTSSPVDYSHLSVMVTCNVDRYIRVFPVILMVQQDGLSYLKDLRFISIGCYDLISDVYVIKMM